VIVAVPLLPWFAALTVAVQLVSHVLLWAEQLLGARVATDQLSVTVPTVIAELTAALNEALEVRRASSVWPFVMLPVVPQLPPSMRNSAPPVAETVAAVLIPLMVTLFDAVSVESAALVTSVKVKAFGVVSHAVCCVQVPLL